MSLYRGVGVVVLVLGLAAPAWAQTPEFAIETSTGGFFVYQTASVNDGVLTATVTATGGSRYLLAVTQAKQIITRVYFPWQQSRRPLDGDLSDDLFYYPFLLGRSEHASNANVDFNWFGYAYPGLITAPLVVMADPTDAAIVAAANWPARTVTVEYAAQRMVVRYDETLGVGGSATFGAIQATVTGQAATGDVPWQKAVDLYRAWLDSVLPPPTYPAWMLAGQGMLDLQLEDYANLSGLQADVTAYLGTYPWLLLWGQMSPQGGGCCGVDPATLLYYANPRSMHSRWISAGLPAYVASLVSGGTPAGYYSAPWLSQYGAVSGSPPSGDLTTSGGLQWLTDWTTLNRGTYGATSYYYDVLMRDYFGQPSTVRDLLVAGTLPNSALAEGINDVWPLPGLVSGSLQGGALCGAPGRTPESVAVTTYPAFGRYIVGDRLIYWGLSNGDHEFWGGFTPTSCDYPSYCSGTTCAFGTERQIFLTGARVEFRGGSNAVLAAILSERTRVNWWARLPRYVGTRDLTLGSLAGTKIEVSHFIDSAGAHLLAVTNPDGVPGKTITLGAQPIAIPTAFITVIETSAPTRGRSLLLGIG